MSKSSKTDNTAAKTNLSLAKQFQSELTEIKAIQGTSETHLHFLDGSVLSFHAVAGSPQPRGMGGIDSFARKVFDSVTNFNLTPKGVEFVFKDESRVSLDLGGATVAHKAH